MSAPLPLILACAATILQAQIVNHLAFAAPAGLWAGRLARRTLRLAALASAGTLLGIGLVLREVHEQPRGPGGPALLVLLAALLLYECHRLHRQLDPALAPPAD